MYYLLIAFFAVYPIADIFVFGDDIGLATITGGLLLAATPIAFVKWLMFDKKRPKLSTPMLAMIAVLAFAAFSGLWAYDLPLYQSYLFVLAQTLALVFVVDLFLENRRSADSLLTAYVAGTVALALLIGWEFLQGSAFSEQTEVGASRYSLEGADPNGKAMQLNIGIAILLGHLDVFKQKALIGGLTLLLFIGVILTGSRTGFIACVVIFSCYMLYESKVVNAFRKWVGALVAATMLFALWDFRKKTINLDRVERMFEEGVTSDLSGRDSLWANAFATFADNPLLGIGYGTIQAYNRDYFGNFLVAHNTHLTFLAEIGFFGYLTFVFAYSFIPYYWFKLKSIELKRTYLAIFATLLISSITLSLAQNFLFWIFIILLERTVRPRSPEMEGRALGEHRNPEIERRLQVIRRP